MLRTILFDMYGVILKESKGNFVVLTLVWVFPAALPFSNGLCPGVSSVFTGADKKKGLFLTILILYSAANAAELLPLVVKQRR